MANGLVDYLNDLRYVEVSNAGASTIPAFGLMRVTGASTTDGLVLTVDQPNADGQDVLINGPTPILAGGRGVATYETPSQVYYDTGDGSPANGETWGAGSGTYKAKKNKAGFKILGGAGSELVVAARQDQTSSGGSGSGLTNFVGFRMKAYTRESGTQPRANNYSLSFDQVATKSTVATDVYDTIVTDGVSGGSSDTGFTYGDDATRGQYFAPKDTGWYRIGVNVKWIYLQDYLGGSFPWEATPTSHYIATMGLRIVSDLSGGGSVVVIAEKYTPMPHYHSDYIFTGGAGINCKDSLTTVAYLVATRRVWIQAVYEVYDGDNLSGMVYYNEPDPSTGPWPLIENASPRTSYIWCHKLSDRPGY